MPGNILEEDIIAIKQKLTKMIGNSDGKMIQGAHELIEALEKMPVNINVLTSTRIGMTLNEFRKKIDDEKLAKRCKVLIKSWKNLIDEKSSQSRTNVGSKSPEEQLEDDKKLPSERTGPIGLSTQSYSKTSTSSSGPSNVRTKSAEMLANALRSGEMPSGTLDPDELASRIEKSLFEFYKDTGDKYKAALRSRVFNLRDKKNQALRENVLTGAVKPEKFAVMTKDEMACEEMKKTRESFTKESIMEYQMSVQQGTPTDMFSTVISTSRTLERQR